MTHLIIRIFRYALKIIDKSAFARNWQSFVPEITTAGIAFWCPNSHCSYRARTLLTKEPDTIAWIDSMQVNEILWDIGANIGCYSLYAARRGCQVIAFEPHAGNYDVLTRNIIINGYEQMIRAYCLAVSDFPGLLTLRTSAISPGTADHRLTLCQDGQAVIAYTAAEMVGELKMPIPNHIKIDVDGAEFRVLSGLEPILLDERIKSVMIEIQHGNSNYGAMLDIFDKSGMKLKDINRMNHLFVRESREK